MVWCRQGCRGGTVKNPPGHIRRLHLVDVDVEGRVHPITDKGPQFCPEVEAAGYTVIDDFSGGGWGHYNFLIWSEGCNYLAAIY